MKIATWNVNSIQVRLPQVLAWLKESAVDVLALQETKTMDAQFPMTAFQEAGYHVAISGQKTYNGVAVIARYPLEEVVKDNPHFEDPQRRFLAVTVNGIRIVNIYVPNGQSVDSDKYAYKLDWLRALAAFLQQELAAHPRLMVLGDFNIAPEDKDVHEPLLWEGNVLVSPRERDAFQALVGLGLIDIVRHYEAETTLYTWWDYRQAAFRRNLGLRIDHILVSEGLLADCQAVGVDKEPRKAERPSDHTPVWTILKNTVTNPNETL